MLIQLRCLAGPNDQSSLSRILAIPERAMYIPSHIASRLRNTTLKGVERGQFMFVRCNIAGGVYLI